MESVIINIEMERNSHYGIKCKDSRPIVIWGKELTNEDYLKLEQTLAEVRQLYGSQSFIKSQSEIITEVCDALYPGHWAFAAQGPGLTF